MSKTISSHVLMALAIALVTPTASRADEQWQVGSAPSFSSGNYGTDTRTEVLQTPFTARRLFDRGDVSVVFPFTCIWGSGNVTLVNGVPVRSERLAYAGLTTRSGTTITTSLQICPEFRANDFFNYGVLSANFDL